jgi:hypothetical protein
MVASVYSRALLKAAELVGGRDRLAKILQVPRADIDRWIADEAKPPREIFLRIVDLILDESRPAGEADDKPEPPARDAAGAPGRYLD